MKCRCGDCGRIFDEDKIVTWQEERGEFWGQTVYETLSGCPYCFGVGVEEYDESEEREDDEDEC